MEKTIKHIFYKNKSYGDYIKKSYLCGVFYYKENMKTFSKEFRILGLPFWKKKVKQGFEKFLFIQSFIF